VRGCREEGEVKEGEGRRRIETRKEKVEKGKLQRRGRRERDGEE